MALALLLGGAVRRLSRLVYDEVDRPIAVEQATFPDDVLVARRAQPVATPATALLTEPPARVLQRLRAVALSDSHAALLSVPPASPAIGVEPRGFHRDGRTVTLSRSRHPGDKYADVTEVA